VLNIVLHAWQGARASALGLNFSYFMLSLSARLLFAISSLGAIGALFLVCGDLLKFAPRPGISAFNRALERSFPRSNAR
jgi:hypothetical protein